MEEIPCIGIHYDRLNGSELGKEFIEFHGMQSFITNFKIACCLSLFSAR
jgi:uncharacterized membrane protein